MRDERATTPYALRRVGCMNCDLVVDFLANYPEELLHQLCCEVCGERDLHHFPMLGSWPSDYERPPCEVTPA